MQLFQLLLLLPFTLTLGSPLHPRGTKPGLAYSPYHADGGCKIQAEVTADLSKLKGFPLIRSYGTSCDQVKTIINAAKPIGMKVMLGIYELGDVSKELTKLIADVGGNWGSVESISIGNEHIHNGSISPGELIAKLSAARKQLKDAKINTKVVSTDTFDALIKNPGVCQASDFASVNIHPWFDSNTEAGAAGQFMKNQIARVAKACPGKAIVVAETGWPWKGDTHGKAVAGRQQQEKALQELVKVTGPSGIFLGPFDDTWKKDHPGSFNAERWWGIANLGVF
ncbi:glycoside hydrolase superfamily [Morchella snyderi]|nr:glycoside hydrolase superfamily [Morchella snyderi]